MSFARLQDLHRQLRLRLRVNVGEVALREIVVSLPRSQDDELSFLRLVVWSYALVNETGRVTFRFLRELPPFSSQDTLDEVRHLRTWATHNLSLESASDRRNLQLAWNWLRTACGTSTPATADEWAACFDRLCGVVEAFLTKALSASNLLESGEDREPLVEELKKRLDRDWDGHRFDQLVADSLARFGFTGVDVVKFRNHHLSAWRGVLAVADDGSAERLLRQRIEKDIADLMNGALPATAAEIVRQVGTLDPHALALLCLGLRERSLNDGPLNEFLENLREEIKRLEVPPQ